MFKIKRRKIKPGFTLIEALISSALTISIMSLVVSFLIKFTGFSTRTINQNEMVTVLRNTQERILPEILPANVVRKDFNVPSNNGSFPTGNINASDKVLIFEVPAPGCGTNTVILEYFDECSTSANPTLCNVASGNINRLKFSLFPSVITAGCRPQIIRQSLNNFINSTDSENAAYPIFKYYKSTPPTQNQTSAVTPTAANISTEAALVTIVSINLWTKKFTGGAYNSITKATENSYAYVNNSTQYVLRNK